MSENPTAGYRWHHTMIRVKNSEKSRDFYERLLGMSFVVKKDFAFGKFTLFFLAYISEEEKAHIPKDEDKAWDWLFARKGLHLELTHNWGTELDTNFSYHNGNQEPRGFGHLCIVVPDVYKCVERLQKEGVKIIKGPDDGSMKGLAFVADPDGYYVEIVKEREPCC